MNSTLFNALNQQDAARLARGLGFLQSTGIEVLLKDFSPKDKSATLTVQQKVAHIGLKGHIMTESELNNSVRSVVCHYDFQIEDWKIEVLPIDFDQKKMFSDLREKINSTGLAADQIANALFVDPSRINGFLAGEDLLTSQEMTALYYFIETIEMRLAMIDYIQLAN